MDIFEKHEIIDRFIQNYNLVKDKELYMFGVCDEDADSICAAAITVIEYLQTKEDTK